MISSDIESRVNSLITPTMVIERLINLLSKPRARSVGEYIRRGDVIVFTTCDGSEYRQEAAGWIDCVLTKDMVEIHGVLGVYPS